MTLEAIRTEMARIKELRRTDVDTAREQWKALRDRLNAYIKNNKLPAMWGKILLEELGRVWQGPEKRKGHLCGVTSSRNLFLEKSPRLVKHF